MNQIDKIIDKLSEIIDLLKELKVSSTAEKCKYLVKFEYSLGDEKVFSLYDTELKKLIMLDRPQRIISYLNLRNIPEELIYKHIIK
jgi:hypothetical protein